MSDKSGTDAKSPFFTRIGKSWFLRGHLCRRWSPGFLPCNSRWSKHLKTRFWALGGHRRGYLGLGPLHRGRPKIGVFHVFLVYFSLFENYIFCPLCNLKITYRKIHLVIFAKFFFGYSPDAEEYVVKFLRRFDRWFSRWTPQKSGFTQKGRNRGI